MAKVNWGIIGCGNIAHTFAKSIAHCANAQLIGAASTSEQRAKEFATHYSVKGYESYQALMQCPHIDAIYIANTHEQHFKTIAQCLVHDKHVLSEKPITVNAQQLTTLNQLAEQQNCFLMEGVWMRFLPAIVKLQQLLSEGVIGKVHSVNANFSLAGNFADSHRLMNPATAGGALLDLGIYPISIADVVFNKAPEQIKSLVHKSTTGVDERSVTLINYGQGQFTQLSSALQQNGPTEACILGEHGYIRIAEFVGAQSLELHLNAQQVQQFDFSFNDDENFKFEIAHVSECILQQQTQSNVLPLSTSLRVMHIMDTLRAQWQLKYSDSVEAHQLD
ncbi:MAG TPA: gfo/Idh/MocA family oxidoreductase [Pseudoalteromonas sp.]|nr:gfo/Idh/MocA family oxidoreductase [Pseudoalteromonas sp.]